MSLKPILAIRFIPHFSRVTGWGDHVDAVCSILGFPHHFPTAREFVLAVFRWQQLHPPLKVDGMLGPNTWKAMYPLVQAYKVLQARMGPHPGWIRGMKVQVKEHPMDSRTTAVKPTAVANASDDSEDKILKEMVSIVMKQRKDPYVAVPVSAAYVAAKGYPVGVRNDITSMPLTQKLEVGQKWNGLKGPRIIVGLSGGGDFGSILFVTESGQAYDQRIKGWESDQFAKVYDDAAKQLAPVKFLIELEIYFLLGVITTASFTGFAVSTGISVTKFILANRDKIKPQIGLIFLLWKLRSFVKQHAPTFYDKLFSLVVKEIINELGDSINNDMNSNAKTLGSLVIKLGKVTLKSRFAFILSILGILMGVVMRVAGAVPGALKLAVEKRKESAKELIEEMKKSGIHLSTGDAETIVSELLTHAGEIRGMVDKLNAAYQELK